MSEEYDEDWDDPQAEFSDFTTDMSSGCNLNEPLRIQDITLLHDCMYQAGFLKGIQYSMVNSFPPFHANNHHKFVRGDLYTLIRAGCYTDVSRFNFSILSWKEFITDDIVLSSCLEMPRKDRFARANQVSDFVMRAHGISLCREIIKEQEWGFLKWEHFNNITIQVSRVREAMEMGFSPPQFFGWRHFDYYSVLEGMSYRIYVTTKVTVIIVPSKRFSLTLTTPHFKGLKYIITQRHGIILGNMIGYSVPRRREYYFSPVELQAMFSLIDMVMNEFGQKGYDFMKAFEGMVNSAFLRLDHKDMRNTVFESDLLNSLGDMKTLGLRMMDLLSSLAKRSPALLSQAYCFAKCAGVPVVSATTGTIKLRKVGQENRPIDFEFVDEVQCNLMMLLYNGYIRKFDNQPPWDYSALDRTDYVRVCIAQGKVVRPDNPHYNFKSWKKVVVRESVHSDKVIPIADLTADKSCSLGISDLKTKIAKDGSIGRGVERRTLLQLLEREEVDLEKMMRDIEENGFSPDDLAIGIVAKEKENKNPPRMFAILPFNLRYYFVYTEYIIYKYILPMFPQIAMGLGDLEKRKKMFHYTKDISKSTHTVSCILNLDFSSWNVRFRDSVVNKSFRDMDKFLGRKNLISRTHSGISSCWIYTADSEAKYELDCGGTLPEGIHSWYRHLGGVEGQRQKGWTVFTVALIDLACRTHGVGFQIIGQGDNQVVRLDMKRSSDDLEHQSGKCYKEKVESVLKSISDSAEKCGLNVKVSESWYSFRTFMFSKEIYFDGCSLPQDLKKLMNAIEDNNDDLPDFQSKIASLSSSVQSACMLSDSPSTAYEFFCYRIRSCLRMEMDCNSGTFQRNSSLSPLGASLGIYQGKGDGKILTTLRVSLGELLAAEDSCFDDYCDFMTLFHSCLGGYHSISYLGLMLRGFPDSLVETLESLWKIVRYNDGSEFASRMIRHARVIMNPPMSERVVPAQLVQDPMSINLLRPMSGSSIITKRVKEFLSGAPQVRNEELQHFLSYSNDIAEQFMEDLFNVEPYYPALMSSLFQASIPGLAMSSTNRIQRTATMLNSTAADSGREFKAYVTSASFYHSVFSIWRYFHGTVVINDNFNSYDSAETLRRCYWKGNGEEDKDIIWTTVPHPSSFLKMVPTDYGRCDECEKGHDSYYSLICSSEFDPTGGILQRTTAAPFVGNTVGSNLYDLRSTSVNRLINLSPLLKLPANLLATLGWIVKDDSPGSKLLISMVQALTDIPYQNFLTPSRAHRGHAMHRFCFYSISNSTMLNALTTLSSCWAMTSNTVALGKKEDNYDILHQGSFLYMDAYWRGLFLAGDISSTMRGLHAHIVFPEKLHKLDESLLGEHPSWNDVVVPTDDTKSKYCFIKKEDIAKIKAYVDLTHCGVRSSEALSTKSLCQAIIHEFCPHGLISGVYDDQDSESTTPIVYAEKVNPVEFLNALGLNCVTDEMFNGIGAAEKPGDLSVQDLANHAISRIHMPGHNSFLLPFVSIYSSPTSRSWIYEQQHPLPRFCEKKSKECVRCLQQSLTRIISEIGTWTFQKLLFEYAQLVRSHPIVSTSAMHTIYDTSKKAYLYCLSQGSIEKIAPYEFLTMVKMSLYYATQGDTPKVTFRRFICGGHNSDPSDAQSLMRALEDAEDSTRLCPTDIYSCVKGRDRHVPGEHNQLRETFKIWRDHLKKMSDIKIAGKSSVVENFGKEFFYYPIKFTEKPEEKIDDQNEHIYRPTCQSTQAGAKFFHLLNVMKNVGFSIYTKKTAIFVADGAGLSTRAALSCGFVSQAIFSTLVDPVKSISSSTDNLLPLALSSVANQIVGGDSYLKGVTDVTNPLFPGQFKNIKKSMKVGFIHCDAENPSWNSVEYQYNMIRNLCIIARNLSRSNIILVVKVYMGQSEASVLLPLCRLCFLKVVVIRLSSSNPSGAEHYICMEGLADSKEALPIYPFPGQNCRSTAFETQKLSAIMGCLDGCLRPTWNSGCQMDSLLRSYYEEFPAGEFALSQAKLSVDFILNKGTFQKKMERFVTAAQKHIRFDTLTSSARRSNAHIEEYHRAVLNQIFYGFILIVASEMNYNNLNKLRHLMNTCIISVSPEDCDCGAIRLDIHAGTSFGAERGEREIRIYAMKSKRVRKVSNLIATDVFRFCENDSSANINSVSTVLQESQYFIEVKHKCPPKLKRVVDEMNPFNFGTALPMRN